MECRERRVGGSDRIIPYERAYVFWMGRGLPGMMPGRDVLGHELQNPIVVGSNPCSDGYQFGGLGYIFNTPLPPQCLIYKVGRTKTSLQA